MPVRGSLRTCVERLEALQGDGAAMGVQQGQLPAEALGGCAVYLCGAGRREVIEVWLEMLFAPCRRSGLHCLLVGVHGSSFAECTRKHGWAGD